MTNAREWSRYGHIFRPGPFHQRRAYWLNGHILHWQLGKEKGHVQLDHIVSMRLHAQEDGDASASQCELVELSGRRHRISDRYWFRWTPEERRRFGRHARHSATFRALCRTLARRLKRANPQAQLLAGPSRGEWIASLAVGATCVAIMIGGTVFMIAQRTLHYPTIAIMALAALHMPSLIPDIRSRGPKPFEPEALNENDRSPG